MLYRRVDELLHFGKCYDLVEPPGDFSAPHPQNRTVKKNVLPASQFRVKARAHFEQGADAATQPDPTFGRIGYSREHLQKRALPGAVSTDQPNHFTLRNIERDILQRPRSEEHTSELQS